MKIQETKRVLIVQTAFLGDVVLTLPLAQRARRLFPQAEIDFVAIPDCENVLETAPYIDEVILYDKNGNDRSAGRFFQLARHLRTRRYDLALVPHRSLRSSLLVWLSGIPLRIGFDASAGRRFFNSVVPYPKGVHEINRNLHLLASFGVDVEERLFPELHFTAGDREAVEGFFAGLDGLQGRDMIALAPGSVWPTKRWLPGEFSRLASRLISDGYAVVLIGGPSDLEVAAEVEQKTGERIFSAVGRLTPRQSALLLKRVLLLVTNDSAPTHLAAAVGTPVVAVFGPTVEAFGFYPYGADDIVVSNHQLSCRPCGLHGGTRCPIGTFECMKSIPAEMVYEQVHQRLAAHPTVHSQKG